MEFDFQNSHTVPVLYHVSLSIESTYITCQCKASYKNYVFLLCAKNDHIFPY